MQRSPLAILVVILCLLSPVVRGQAETSLKSQIAVAVSSPASAPATPSADQIRAAVRMLNHPSVSRRQAAIRKLAEWGPLAFAELRKAAADRNLEAALSARDLLAELESAILLGARVRLEVSRSRVAWNEAFDLTVIAENLTPAPMQIPWPAPTTRPAGDLRGASEPAARAVASSQPAGEAGASKPAKDQQGEGGSAAAIDADVEQVASMMDAADFFEVTSPGGEALEPRVEPIERDPAVWAAVDQRARGTSPTHQIPPGATARLVIRQFNRGWARYPLLRKGAYTIAFRYQPKWRDGSWIEAGFGLVRGGSVRVEITEPAPKTLLDSTSPLTMRIERRGERVEAIIESHWDRDLWVNLNLGGPPSTHSRMDWQLTQQLQDNAEPVDLEVEGAAEFHADKLVRIEAGSTIVAGSVAAEVIREKLAEAMRERRATYALQTRYLSLASPAQLRHAVAALGRRAEIPVHLFSGSLTSDEVEVEKLLGTASQPASAP